MAEAINAINDQTAKTGVIASLDDTGTRIVMESQNGANIQINDYANQGDITMYNDTTTAVVTTLLGDTLAQAVQVTGELTIDSDKSFVLTSSLASASQMISSASVGSTLNSVADLDITDVDNAYLAMAIADAALTNITGQRAKFGALQSRFESTVANLSTSIENLSSARSRIQDADFAEETAALTRAQILQQAGVSMLAQANTLPQNVLSLLQG